ncbi:hypothetical protein F4781DRAFT_334201 [Annulohypoxylon bovei var. microspora]|nr:hypothetical protein F4781DRAFT_334201 [Annulohypoxylon bovei var. microspora]
MGKSSSDPPETPTRIPRPASSAGVNRSADPSPTRPTSRRGTGLLQAVGRSDLFRGARGLTYWPLGTSLDQSQGSSAGPMNPAAHQSSIPPPLQSTYQHHPTTSTSSRGRSASMISDSPESQLTTGYTSVTTSTSPEGLTAVSQGPLAGNQSHVSTPVATPEYRGGFHPYAPALRHRRGGSSLPVPSPRRGVAQPLTSRPPPEPQDIAYIPAGAWMAHELKLENLPPAESDSSLGSKHRDSLRLASVQHIPRLTPPGVKKGTFDEFFIKGYKDSMESDRFNAQMAREMATTVDPPVAKKDSFELPRVQYMYAQELPGAKKSESIEQESIAPKKYVERTDADQKSGGLSPSANQENDESTFGADTSLMSTVRIMANMELEDTNDFDSSKHSLPMRMSSLGPREGVIDLTAAKRTSSQGLTHPKRLTSTQSVSGSVTQKGPEGGNPQQQQLTAPTSSRTKSANAPGQSSTSQLPRPTQNSTGQKGSGFSKSRTRTVLNNLSSSFSRPSFPSFGRIHSRRHTPSSTMAPSPSNEDDSSAATLRPANDASSSQPPQLPQASSAHHLDSVRLIYDAQEMQFWSGRFMSLEDRFRSENLSPENMAAIIGATTKIPGPVVAKRHNPAGLPTSSTMGCLAAPSTDPYTTEARERASHLTDDDSRVRRVFAHLEDLCMTDAARDSLREFQQRYARKHGTEWLLPPGGTMHDDSRGKGKRWASRIFSGAKDRDNKDKDKEGGKKGGPSR